MMIYGHNRYFCPIILHRQKDILLSEAADILSFFRKMRVDIGHRLRYMNDKGTYNSPEFLKSKNTFWSRRVFYIQNF